MEEAAKAAPPRAADRNRYGVAEWAGAFGDLGTLLPFAMAYIAVVKVAPLGMLLAFGAAMIAVGLYYRTPVPVQPMKAIGAVAATQAAQVITVTPHAVYAASLVTGLLWLALAASGLIQRVATLVPRPVRVGIVLGLGFAFILEGLKMMAAGWALASAGLALVLLLLDNRRVPAMFALLAFGAAAAVILEPALIGELARVRIGLRMPQFALGALGWHDAFVALVFLALPQLPLTFGNAVLGVVEANNREFPERPIDARKAGLSTGLMNLVGAAVGGVPMCHGAGGLAAHVRFGARTGGALVILGSVLVVVALLFSDSVATLLRIFPVPVLGVMLFLTGAQLALGSCDFSHRKEERFATLVTAGCSIWNVGLGFALGWIVLALLRRGWVRL
jgi:MFS superfamily sulfate permease-like transporter